jgi:quercetin dioxygenase-like cupin family protein
VRTGGAETNGELLVFDLFLPPGKQVPSRHAHPHQEETFTILQGVMLFKLGRKTIMARPGDTVAVPPGVAHWFGNRGSEEVVARVTARPALRMEEMFEATAAVQIGEARSLLARLSQLPALAGVVVEFRREVAVPSLPQWLVIPLLRAVAALQRPRRRPRRRLRRRLRQPPDQVTSHE